MNELASKQMGKQAGKGVREPGVTSGLRRVYGRVVEGSSSEPESPGSSLETIDILANNSGQAVSLFTKQCKLVPAGYIIGWC